METATYTSTQVQLTKEEIRDLGSAQCIIENVRDLLEHGGLARTKYSAFDVEELDACIDLLNSFRRNGVLTIK